MPDYQASYLREKKARKQAEQLLEDKSRQLYLANEELKSQYKNISSEFRQKSLLLQVARYSQYTIKLSDLLPDIVNTMLAMANLGVGFFEYYPQDNQRPNFRSDIYTHDLDDTEKPWFDVIKNSLLKEGLDNVIVEALYSRDVALHCIDGDGSLVVDDAKTDDSGADGNGNAPQLAHLLIIPVVASNHVAATLYLIKKPGSAIEQDYVSLFSSSMQQLAVLIEHRYNEEKLERSYYQLKAMIEELGITQKQLVQSEKLASIGQLSAGIAHEINNPMAYIKSNLNTLDGYLDHYQTIARLANEALNTAQTDSENDGTEFLAYWKKYDFNFLNEDSSVLIEETRQGISRVAEIVSGLKTFARSSDQSWSAVNINECLKEALKLAENVTKYKADVSVDLMEVPPVNGNSGEIIQVLLNLVVNAAQAIEAKGQIAVGTRIQGAYIEIYVKDSGQGIAEQDLQRIFDPFFSTKEVGEGTGLGLSISFGIIENHRGSIEVQSEQTIGTTFIVRLPRAV